MCYSDLVFLFLFLFFLNVLQWFSVLLNINNTWHEKKLVCSYIVSSQVILQCLYPIIVFVQRLQILQPFNPLSFKLPLVIFMVAEPGGLAGAPAPATVRSFFSTPSTIYIFSHKSRKFYILVFSEIFSLI